LSPIESKNVETNAAPTAVADSFSTPQDSMLMVGGPGVLGNDTDPDGDSLSASLVSDVSNGTLTLDDDGSFGYSPDDTFTGTDQFTYEASDGNGGSDQATVHLRITEGPFTRLLSLEAGWNLVSVPLEVEDPTFGAVMSSLCGSGFVFVPGSGYDGIGGSDPLPPGEGFWVNCSPGTVEVNGPEPDTLSVAVEVGWNIIGPFADSVDVESIASDPPGIVQSSLFGFDGSGGYQSVSALAPGEGYWVKAGESGTLDLSGSSGGAALAAKALATPQANASSKDGSEVRLVLTDARGREATLRLAQDLSEQKRQRSALPPVPPSGIFDVRFEGDRSVAEAGGGDLQSIETQGLKAPVTVELVGAEAGQSVRLSHGDETTRLTAKQDAAELSSTDGLAVGLRSVPEEFALGKPYPNPSGGQATLEYALPEQAEVRISVYDVLGRRVATVAEGTKPAGRHSADLEGARMPSGTYFVRMRAEGFQQTRRLTVVR